MKVFLLFGKALKDFDLQVDMVSYSFQSFCVMVENTGGRLFS